MAAERIIQARYKGWCGDCGGRIQKGEEIRWSRKFGARHNFMCVDAEAELAEAQERRHFDSYYERQEALAA